METKTTIPTFRERFNARLEGRKIEKSEKGLALLDVLIGMAIFGLIASIALSAISQYRARAYESAVISDARQLGLVIEAAATDGVIDTTDVVQDPSTGVVTVGSEEVVLSHRGDNVLLMVAVPNAANAFTMRFCVVHAGSEWALFDTAMGGIAGSGRSQSDADIPGDCQV